jgi:NADH-quinone oxidoreductase subunit J
MTVNQIIFILVASITLGAAILVVTAKKLIHSALWLILSLFGIAILYVILNASFFAVAQVVIYIGAIAILMIFVIMLTRNLAEDIGPRFNRSWPWAVLVSLLFFGGFVWLLSSWSGINQAPPDLSTRADPLTSLGVSLVSPEAYVIPFELVSVLLLAALIGAIIVAWPAREDKKEGQEAGK